MRPPGDVAALSLDQAGLACAVLFQNGALLKLRTSYSDRSSQPDASIASAWRRERTGTRPNRIVIVEDSTENNV
jgi:hypothetical protein